MAQLSSVTIRRIKNEGYKACEDGLCKCDNPYPCNQNKSLLWLAAFDSGTPNKFEGLR